MVDQPQPQINALEIDHPATWLGKIRVRCECSLRHCASDDLSIEPLQ